MSGPRLSTMAWRNLWRNRRRTIITMSAITFGIFLAVVFTGMGDSTYTDMINLAARMGGGHVSVQHPNLMDTPSLKWTVSGTDRIRERAADQKHVLRTSARITGQAMLATAGQNYGAVFMAYDPAEEDTTTFSIFEALQEGEFFDSASDKGIIIGSKLAENLDLTLGKKVVYTMTDKRGDIVSTLARVTGIIGTGAPSVDAGLCLLPIGTVRDVLGYDSDEATMVAVFISDQRKSEQVAGSLMANIVDAVAIHTWSETQPELAGFISMKVAGAKLFEGIILVLVAAGIFNTLFVSVMERMREFGIMMAIGFSPFRLFRLVMWESLWLGVVGVLASIIITAGPYYLMNKYGLDMSTMVGEGTQEVAGVAIEPTMYVEIYPENAVIIAVVVLLITMISGLYPAWKAGRVAPVETIKLV